MRENRHACYSSGLVIEAVGGQVSGSRRESRIVEQRLCPGQREPPGGFSDCTSGAVSKTLAGSAWGSGLEWNLGGHWSAKAEYLYYNLGGLSFSAPNALNPVNPFRSSVNFKGNIVRIGLNYKLGGM